MFRFAVLALIALTSNAVAISEAATSAEVEQAADVLKAPGQEDLADGVRIAGDSIVDDMILDFEVRQALREERKEGRRERREAREAILARTNPDYETKLNIGRGKSTGMRILSRREHMILKIWRSRS